MRFLDQPVFKTSSGGMYQFPTGCLCARYSFIKVDNPPSFKTTHLVNISVKTMDHINEEIRGKSIAIFEVDASAWGIYNLMSLRHDVFDLFEQLIKKQGDQLLLAKLDEFGIPPSEIYRYCCCAEAIEV